MGFSFPEINFPAYEHKLKKEKDTDYIWDPIRKSWIQLNPEEWVRQNLVRYLIDDLSYPSGLMQVECKIKVGAIYKRFDLVVMDASLQPWLICECKAPSVQITQPVLEQAAIYNSTLKCKYLTVTNGLKHYCYEIDFKSGSIQSLPSFPVYK